MVRSWAVYLLSLFSSFVFFLCYKMWVSWICLIVIVLIPVLSLVMSLIASRTMTFKVQCPGNVLIGTPTNILVTTGGIASYFSFCKLKLTVTDRMAGTTKKRTFVINDKGTSKIPVDTSHCGAYSYDLSWLTVYDLFGLFFTKTNVNKFNEILVKPSPSMPDVMPDMYGFKAKNLRKSKQPGAEIYDIKEYQIGDSIRSIHWKMSAKKDTLLVKEPLEEYGGHSRVILRLTGDRDKFDLHLGQIVFTSRFYIEHETSHKIRIIPPDKGEVAFEIESENDLERAISKILRMQLPKEDPHKKSDADDKAEPNGADDANTTQKEDTPDAD